MGHLTGKGIQDTLSGSIRTVDTKAFIVGLLLGGLSRVGGP